VKQPLALTSPTWVRGVRRVLREGAHPRGAKNREKQNSCFSPKPCQVVAHARARVGKIRLFDQPYNPRMLTQESVTRTNPAKAEAKLAKRLGAIHRLWPVSAVTNVRACVRGRQLRRVTVRCLFQKLSRGKSREIAGNRRFNGMAGESVALNPALRERNRNLKGCGLTGLLCWVGIAPATLRSKNSRTVPALRLRGGEGERGVGVFGKAVTSLDCI
jgi:hypothetical protein